MPRPFPAGVEPEELEHRYRLEKRLADRLRLAAPGERSAVYAEVYSEYARHAEGAEVDAGSLELQTALLTPWLDERTVFAEVGAGSGVLARRVAAAGPGRRVLAIEAVPGESGGAVEWLAHDETGSRIASQTVDVAYSCHVLEHLHPEDAPDHFREVLRWLRPSAPYLMVTPNRLCGPHDISGYFSDRPEGFHLREYTHGELAAVARRAGFSRISALGRSGLPAPLWRASLAERALEAAGPSLRRWLFDRFPPIAQRAPLRPLEQVALAAFKDSGSP
ncbi:MAG: class I SAM-dependent methyltransferase [Acidobacteriota bacterium]